MNTFQEQKEFFERHWPAMRHAIETGGAPAAVQFIEGTQDDLERRVLYTFARQGLVMQEWSNKSFDPYIEVCDAGIAEMLRQAEAAPDEETRKRRINGAHVLSFNMAADLADCWPGDTAPRTAAHFQRGLRAADDCIGWCDASIIDGLANDHWVKGMHQLSLGDAAGAVASWKTSLEYARESARRAGKPTEVSPEAGFGVILGSGYVGIGQSLLGDPAGPVRLAAAVGAFTAQLERPEMREDAEFGIAQLRKVAGKYAPDSL